MCQVSLFTLDASKKVKFRLSRNSTKFDRVAKFCETIPTVKFVLSPEILKNSGFSTEITVVPFVRKIEFFSSFTYEVLSPPVGRHTAYGWLGKNKYIKEEIRHKMFIYGSPSIRIRYV